MTNLKAKLIGLLFRLNPAIKSVVGKRRYPETKAAFEQHYREIDARTEPQKGTLAFHRMLMISGLALYKSLGDELEDQEERVERIHEILWNGPMSKMIRIVAWFIRRSRDPFHRFLQVLGPYNEWFFPCPPWEKKRVDLAGGTGWHQTRCPHNDFFRKEGAVELTRAFCDMDKRIAAFLPDHVELQRQHRLAAGDDWCDFLYCRKPTRT